MASRGGYKQRLQRAAVNPGQSSASNPVRSSLALWLLQEWAWGRFSPQVVQHIAMLAVRDMDNAACTGRG